MAGGRTVQRRGVAARAAPGGEYSPLLVMDTPAGDGFPAHAVRSHISDGQPVRRPPLWETRPLADRVTTAWTGTHGRIPEKIVENTVRL